MIEYISLVTRSSCSGRETVGADRDGTLVTRGHRRPRRGKQPI